MSRTDKAAAVLGIVATAEMIYDRYVTRRRNRDLDARDQRIRDLESRLAKLEQRDSRPPPTSVPSDGVHRRDK